MVIWKLHDFMNNFYESFIRICLYLLIAICLMNVHTSGTSKDSGGSVYTPKHLT